MNNMEQQSLRSSSPSHNLTEQSQQNKLNFIKFYSIPQQSQFKCHFHFKKIYMPRKESITDYFNRLRKLIQPQGTVAIIQMSNVYANQLVDIDVGMVYDKDAINIINNSVSFKFVNKQGNQINMKPIVSAVFKIYLQLEAKGSDKQKQRQKQRQRQREIQRQRQRQRQRQKDRTNHLMNNNTSSTINNHHNNNQFISNSSNYHNNNNSHNNNNNSNYQNYPQKQVLSKRPYDHYDKERIDTPKSRQFEKVDNRIVYIKIICVPKEYGTEQLIETFNQYPKGQIIVNYKDIRQSQENEMWYYQVALSQKNADIVLEWGLSIKGIPLLLLQKKDISLKHQISQYQIRVLTVGDKIMAKNIYSLFRKIGSIVNLFDFNNHGNHFLITFSKRRYVQTAVSKQFDGLKVVAIDKSQGFKLQRISVKSGFYNYIRSDE